MASHTETLGNKVGSVNGRSLEEMPLLYEDEEEEERDMGETNLHYLSGVILVLGFRAHFAAANVYQAFGNMNLYYHPRDARAYISPDVMVVKGFNRLPEDLTSYRIGEHGPAPVCAAEVLSERSAQQRDLAEKMTVYAMLGVAEYILVDLTGRFLNRRLLLKRLQPDGTWTDEQDADGGITSQLGFRVILDADGFPRVLDAATGKRYIRPDEADAETRARDERIAQLEAELSRLSQKKE